MSNEYPATELAIAPAVAGHLDRLMELSAGALTPISVNGAHYIVVPPEYSAKPISDDIEKAQLRPNRKRGEVRLKSLESLLAYANDQTAQGSGYLYADPDTRTITAVFNDNRAFADAGWRDHRATFTAELTPEAQRWLERNGKPFGQEEFGEFIEDNLADIREPSAQTLLEVATTIQAKTDIAFSSAKRLDNGQVQLVYTENINATAGANGALQIPREFQLGLRLFKGDTSGYSLRARLKYRLGGGSVKFFYELDRPERAIEDAFAAYVQQAREQSGYTVLIGRP